MLPVPEQAAAGRAVKKKVYALAIAYPFAVAINLTFFQSFLRFHTITYVLGCFIVIYLCITYFRELLQSDVLYRLTRLPAFWITCANLLYYTASMIYMGSINFIVAKDMDRYGTLIQIFVYSFTSIQYLLYIAALLCTWTQKRK